MVSAQLITVFFILLTTTSASEICKDTVKALVEARHQEFHRDFKSMESSVNRLKKIVDHLKVMKGSGTYIRWGRTSCPGSAKLIYKGYVGGAHHGHHGPSKNLCLPDRPDFSEFVAGTNDQGLIYGTEYETGTAIPTLKSLNHHDIPCAVCKASRSSVVMIPAKNTCTKGWKREYHGYLMSGHHGHNGVGDYICVDGKPEAIAGGNSNQDHHIMYMVEAKCGPLPCPPYNDKKELTCVVCSA